MPFAAHLGVFPLPVAGESRNAPPSVDDIARGTPQSSTPRGQELPPDWPETPQRCRNGCGYRPRRRPQSAACEDAALDVLQGSQGARPGALPAQRPQALLPGP